MDYQQRMLKKAADHILRENGYNRNGQPLKRKPKKSEEPPEIDLRLFKGETPPWRE